MSGAAAQKSEIEALAKAVALARQRADAGDLTSARTLLESALAIGELRLGRDHPQLVPLMVDLATIAREVGNLTESQAQLSRAYEIAVLATGPEHPSALKIEARLAVVTGRLGEPTDAYDWHLADAGARVLGPDHAAVRSARERLGARHGMGPGGTPSADEDPDRPVIAPIGPPPPAALPSKPASLPSRPALLPSRPAALPVVPPPADPPATGDLRPPPTYMPTLAPGVYERRPDAVQIYTPAPLAEFSGQEIAIWPEPDEPTRRARPHRTHRAGLAVVAGIGAAVLIASAIVAVKALGPASVGAASGQGPTPPPATLTVAPSTPPPTPTPSPTLAANPPTEVRLADAGGSVTLTWRDPTGGRVPFLLTGGRVGTGARPLESIPAGRTRSIVYGLNNKFDYCFIVSAVYSATLIAPSIRICTHRLSTGSTT